VLLRVGALRPRLWDSARRLVAALDGEPPVDIRVPPPRDFALPFEGDVPWAILTPSSDRLFRAVTQARGAYSSRLVSAPTQRVAATTATSRAHREDPGLKTSVRRDPW